MTNDNEQKYKEWISNEYLELCRKKRLYDQIRYLDETGTKIQQVGAISKKEILFGSIVKPQFYFQKKLAVRRILQQCKI